MDFKARKCPHCGNNVRADAVFCLDCGLQIAKTPAAGEPTVLPVKKRKPAADNPRPVLRDHDEPPASPSASGTKFNDGGENAGRRRHMLVIAVFLLVVVALLWPRRYFLAKSRAKSKPAATAAAKVKPRRLQIISPHSTLPEGGLLQLRPRLIMSDGSVSSRGKYYWRLEEGERLAEVNQSGLLKARHYGRVKVHLSGGSLSASISIMITPIRREVRIQPGHLTMRVGETAVFRAVGVNSDGSTGTVDVKWKVLPDSLGVIDGQGRFIAKSYGHVEVRAVVGRLTGLSQVEISAPAPVKTYSRRRRPKQRTFAPPPPKNDGGNVDPPAPLVGDGGLAPTLNPGGGQAPGPVNVTVP